MNDPDSEGEAILKELTVEAADTGLRVDQWLAAQLAPDLSRSRIQALIRNGQVMLNDDVMREPRRKLKAGERIMIIMPEPEPATPQPENIPLRVLHEDDDLIVIDKPAGLVVHPGAGNPTGTLVNALLSHCGSTLSDLGGMRPGIVHRLDKDTSGVLVAARNDRTRRALSQSFADHGRSGDLERVYDALVWGAPARMTGAVDAPLGRAADRTRRAVVASGHPDARHAVTHFTVIERFGEAVGAARRPGGEPVASLVECRLETGRTHQIRVHMAHIGHPLVGDRDYGRAFFTRANRLAPPLAELVRAFPRQVLHARLLAFRHPTTREWMHFEAPWPHDMMELVDGFRRWTNKA